ncbi:hypothetical protein BaRGS_00031171 [Batillaria attramentaria]|uniref:Uncharacterized protein n=1 Tax=Batillaria attramentaria TaxID=370345 RepID=A0ABD0JRN0_9CAEN
MISVRDRPSLACVTFLAQVLKKDPSSLGLLQGMRDCITWPSVEVIVNMQCNVMYRYLRDVKQGSFLSVVAWGGVGKGDRSGG